jgi:heptosyltransferase-2
MPRLHVSSSAVMSLAERLQASGIPAHRPLITLHPGARNGKAKRWPVEHWSELANLLTQRLDATVVIVGAPGERATAHQIIRAVAEPIYDLTGKTALPELAALLARSDLVISGDSGPMHIACAVDSPVIGLFGPTDPRISGPLGADAVVMGHDIWCGPCYDASTTADCRFHNPVCMKAIPARTVFLAAKRQLARLSPPIVTAQQARPEEHTIATPESKRLRSH